MKNKKYMVWLIGVGLGMVVSGSVLLVAGIELIKSFTIVDGETHVLPLQQIPQVVVASTDSVVESGTVEPSDIKADMTDDVMSETKSEAKAESASEVKSEAKAESASDAKSEVKTEAKLSRLVMLSLKLRQKLKLNRLVMLSLKLRLNR